MSNALATRSLAPAACLSFTTPLADLGELSALPEARRTEVQVTLRLLERVHQLRGNGSLQTACQTVAATSRHLMRGCSASSLMRKYYAYLGSVDETHPSGDWRALVANYKGPSSLPAEFVSYVRGLAEDNHRSMAAAWELVHEQWRSGYPIPGYGTWAEYHLSQYPDRPMPKVCPRAFLPSGWSKRNLYRKAPNKGARSLAQRGLAASKKFFPSVKRDPSSLRPMEMIVIDDFELDCLCVFPGNAEHKPQIGRVAGLLAMCVGTRRKLHWGIGQRLERDERQDDGTIKTIRTGIARIDVQLFLLGLFEKFGLPSYKVTILCENAAASISPELQLALETLFEGRVEVERTGLIEHKTLTNGFVERGGKPWEKGWIESAFNSLWNTLGSMPGYKGSNQRLNGPADLDAKIAYTKLLIGQGERALNLPPEDIIKLRLPFPSPEAVERAFAWACSVSDRRTDHNYLGFSRVTEFLLEEGGEPQPFAALALLPASAQAQVQIVERNEAPVERWQRLGQGVVFTPLPRAALALLVLTPKRVSYRNHSVTFEHNKVGYTYVDAKGDVLSGLPDGTEFLAFLNPGQPHELHLATLKGAYAGTLTRLGGAKGMVDIRDKDALREAGGVARQIVNRTLAEVRERHADQDAQLAVDRQHNAEIVAAHKAATKGLSTAEKIGRAAGETAQKAVEAKAEAKALQGADDLDATKLF
ncbi:MAG TPA: hypothetical protein VGD88_06170 [Opitutaceae bacterium]